MPTVTNIAAYQFASLTDLKTLRDELIDFCKSRGLRGTILLSTEGINLFVAGASEPVEALLTRLREVPGLETLTAKYSESTAQPFTRMLVRIKKEIIAFGVDGIEPARRTSPKLAPAELKRWLDEGRPVTLLDTRNDYEVRLGTFHNALTLDIDHFRQFPKAVESLPEDLKKQPVVMFCTGGIRCEKAGPYMEREGFEHIYQLDGGILKYFEDCGHAHYDGECFVFDHRVGVDPALRESESTQCYVCQAPLTPMEQRDPRYIPGQSCPYCYRASGEKMEDTIARRHDQLAKLIDPLPGSIPAENRRPVRVPQNFDGHPLLDFLTTAFQHHSKDAWRKRCTHGLLVDESDAPLAANTLLRAGQKFFYRIPGEIEPPVNPGFRILFEDEALVVINKSAPLPVHPSGRFHRNSLQHFLNALYHPERPRPAHRLDANTTGVLVCARTRQFARMLQPQFEDGTVQKSYLARVHGHPPDNTFDCRLPISAGPRELGSREPGDTPGALPAHTSFRVIRRDDDNTALVEATPHTGRTNQIRVHLWALGHAIIGDPAYRPDGTLGLAMTLDPSAPPMMLHAARLTFRHPLSGEEITFEAGCEW